MSNKIMKFNYNSSHNNFPAIESLNPIDIGTEKQFRFTAKMLETMFDVSINTIKNRIEALVNVGDLSCQNFDKTNLPDSRGSLHETTIYDLTVLNKLAMTMIDNPIAVNVRKAFNDVIVQVETTGQYNTQPVVPQTYLEALKALVASEEEKEQLKLTNETLNQELTNVCEQRDKAIRERGYINDKRLATIMSHEGVRARKINKLENELSDTIEKLTDTVEKLDQAKVELELAKSSMFTNKRVCEMLRDRFEITWADSTLKSRTSKALQSIANEFGENIIYDKQFVDGVLRKVPYYTQRTADILMQRLEYDCAYLKQF